MSVESWDNTLAHDVGDWLKRYRARNRLRQEDMAVILAWPQSVIARLERGARMPSMTTLHRISVRLGVNITIKIRAHDVTVSIVKPRARKATA